MIILCDNKKCPLKEKCARFKEKKAPGQEVTTFNFYMEVHPFTQKEIVQCRYQKTH